MYNIFHTFRFIEMTFVLTRVECMYLSNTTLFYDRIIYSIYYIRYNYMFRHLTMAIFRLYMKYLVSSISCTTWRWPLSSTKTCSCTLCSKCYIYIPLPSNKAVLDKYIHSTLLSILNITGVTNLMPFVPCHNNMLLSCKICKICEYICDYGNLLCAMFNYVKYFQLPFPYLID